jgi:predicted DNA-binding transcriptional regulator YafY
MQNPGYSLAEIAEEIGCSKRTVSRQMKLLQEAGIITRVGSSKTGHWEVMPHTDWQQVTSFSLNLTSRVSFSLQNEKPNNMPDF